MANQVTDDATENDGVALDRATYAKNIQDIIDLRKEISESSGSVGALRKQMKEMGAHSKVLTLMVWAMNQTPAAIHAFLSDFDLRRDQLELDKMAGIDMFEGETAPTATEKPADAKTGRGGRKTKAETETRYTDGAKGPVITQELVDAVAAAGGNADTITKSNVVTSDFGRKLREVQDPVIREMAEADKIGA